jgi:hypothetical protein
MYFVVPRREKPENQIRNAAWKPPFVAAEMLPILSASPTTKTLVSGAL